MGLRARAGSFGIILATVVLFIAIYVVGLFVLAQPLIEKGRSQIAGAAAKAPVTGSLLDIFQAQNVTLVLVLAILILNVYAIWRGARKEHIDLSNFKAVRDDIASVREAVLRGRVRRPRRRRRR